eukprot:scaffold43486_cov183-Amphora_coffeaeformis.AAC.2
MEGADQHDVGFRCVAKDRENVQNWPFLLGDADIANVVPKLYPITSTYTSMSLTRMRTETE